MFSCEACLELLYEPITLPCGYSICKRCFRISPSTNVYSCLSCKKNHQSRNIRINIILNNILTHQYPIETFSYSLIKHADITLKTWFNTPFSEIKISEILDIITNYLSPAINASPFLQLPLLLRAKAYSELGLFIPALSDTKRAHQLQPKNNRGLISEKLIKWRLQTFKSNIEFNQNLLERLETINEPPQNSILYPSKTNSISISDFECTLCLQIIVNPITAPCGHSWCKHCILQLVTHTRNCPLCRSEMPHPSYFSKRPVTKLIQNLTINLFNNQMALRKTQLITELGADLANQLFTDGSIPSFQESISIFVCSLVFPGSTLTFQIFEPRYRVMIQRCWNSTKKFGICLADKDKPGECMEFGTVVEICQIKSMEGDLSDTVDGPLPRFIIQVRGLYRFKILNSKMDSAGYFTSKIEKMNDLDPEDEWNNYQEKSVSTAFFCQIKLLRGCINRILEAMEEQKRARFVEENGKIPDEPSDFSFWVANQMSMDPYCAYELLKTCSICERIEMISKWMDI